MTSQTGSLPKCQYVAVKVGNVVTETKLIACNNIEVPTDKLVFTANSASARAVYSIVPDSSTNTTAYFTAMTDNLKKNMVAFDTGTWYYDGSATDPIYYMNQNIVSLTETSDDTGTVDTGAFTLSTTVSATLAILVAALTV